MDADLIIREMIKVSGIPNQKALSEYFDVSEPYITKWKKKNLIPSEFINKFDEDYKTSFKKIISQSQKPLKDAVDKIKQDHQENIDKAISTLPSPNPHESSLLQDIKSSNEDIKKEEALIANFRLLDKDDRLRIAKEILELASKKISE